MSKFSKKNPYCASHTFPPKWYIKQLEKTLTKHQKKEATALAKKLGFKFKNGKIQFPKGFL